MPLLKSVDIESWGKGMWTSFTELAKHPRSQTVSPDRLPDLLREESEVENILWRYQYFHDADDIEGIMSLYTEDCVVVNMRGTYVGAEALRKNYEYMLGLSRMALHLTTNSMVRLEESLLEGWLAAFYYAIAISKENRMRASGGTYLNRVVKRDGTWKIQAQRTTINFRHDLDPCDIEYDEPPAPSAALSSRDLIEPQYLL